MQGEEEKGKRIIRIFACHSLIQKMPILQYRGPTPKERDRNHKSHEVTEVAVTELQTKDFTDNTARKR